MILWERLRSFTSPDHVIMFGSVCAMIPSMPWSFQGIIGHDAVVWNSGNEHMHTV